MTRCRLRVTVVRATLLAAAVLAAAGCSASTPSVRASARASASAPNPAEACARLVGYWAEQEATPNSDWGLDYQERGLSQGENAILLSLLPAARSLAARQGVSAVGPAATGWARPRCRAYLAGAGATASPGPWPQ